MYELPDIPGCVLMQSKDQITAGNAARKDRMEGKAAISNTTTSCVFQLLQEAGFSLEYVRDLGRFIVQGHPAVFRVLPLCIFQNCLN